MVDEVRDPYSRRDVGHAEPKLDGAGPHPRMPETLNDDANNTDEKGLRQAEDYNTRQQENEQHGHRPCTAGKPHLEARCRHRKREIAEEAYQFVRLPVEKTVPQSRRAYRNDASDIDLSLS